MLDASRGSHHCSACWRIAHMLSDCFRVHRARSHRRRGAPARSPRHQLLRPRRLTRAAPQSTTRGRPLVPRSPSAPAKMLSSRARRSRAFARALRYFDVYVFPCYQHDRHHIVRHQAVPVHAPVGLRLGVRCHHGARELHVPLVTRRPARSFTTPEVHCTISGAVGWRLR